MDERIWLFVEPHITGGHCTVEITDEQIIAFMSKSEAKEKGATRDQLIDEFVVVNWCWEKER